MGGAGRDQQDSKEIPWASSDIIAHTPELQVPLETAALTAGAVHEQPAVPRRLKMSRAGLVRWLSR